MDIPFLKHKQEEKIWGLFLKDNSGTVFLFQKKDSEIELLDKTEFQFTNGWNNISKDIDEAVYRLSKDLDEDIDKLIIFLYSRYVDQETKKIELPYLQEIKAMVKELEFIPLGFMEINESIVNYYQKKKDVPFTGVLVEVGESIISTFIYKNGQSISSEKTVRTPSFMDDLLSTLNKQTQLLPPKIVLYDSGNLDKESEKILDFKFDKKFFIHPPKVEIITPEEIEQGLIETFKEQLIDKEKKKEKQQTSEKVMGFEIGKDIDEEKQDAAQTPIKENSSSSPKEFITNLFIHSKAITTLISNLKNTLLKSKAILAISSFIVVFILLGIAVEATSHKTVLEINPEQKTINTEVTINNMPYDKINKSIDLKSTLSTSGKREIGKKATGKATLYNFTSTEKLFNKGSIFQYGKLQFVLTDSTVVASASEKLINGKPVREPGSKTANLEAAKIGSAYNIKKGVKLTPSNLSSTDYYAMTSTSFTGGEKSEINTVSKTDMAKLENKLIKETKDKSATFLKEISKDKLVLNSLTEVALSDKKYDKEIGEKANSISLSAKGETTFYIINKESFEKIILQQIRKEESVPSKFDIKNLSSKILKSELSDDNISLDLKVTAKAVQKVNKDQLIKDIRLKSRKNIETLLENKYDINNYSIQIDSIIPFFKNVSSPFTHNIKVVSKY